MKLVPFIIYCIIVFAIVSIAGHYTEFNKSYWIGFAVATILDIIWTGAKAASND